jgi:hypothetical protein
MFKVNVCLIAVKFIRPTWEECGPCPICACSTLAFALQPRKIHGTTLSQGSRKVADGHDTVMVIGPSILVYILVENQ